MIENSPIYSVSKKKFKKTYQEQVVATELIRYEFLR